MSRGPVARWLRTRLLVALALPVLVALAPTAFGQNYWAPGPAYPGGGAYAPGGPAYGGAYAAYGPMYDGGFHGPQPMGAGGTCPPAGYDLMSDVGVEGTLVDQRGPHYFDARLEAVWLTRDDTFGRDIDFTSFLIATDVNSEIVLSSDQLDYGTEVGFRVMGRYDVCPLSVVEFGFMGIYDYSSGASFADPNPVPNPVNPIRGNLFSLFSEFGTNPPNTPVDFGPMPHTERSFFQSIAIESDLQSAEISYRRYWVGFSPNISGTLLAGFRYTKLNETFTFITIGEARADNFTVADNNLAGLQTGADMWIGLSQGLRFGMEGKMGIYNNHYTLRNEIITTPLGDTPPTLFELFREDQPAFIGELSFDLVADILPSWSFRIGYEFLFLNSIVLAGENFNTGSPYNRPDLNPNPELGPPRVPFINDQGDAFYHGGHIGLEFIW